MCALSPTTRPFGVGPAPKRQTTTLCGSGGRAWQTSFIFGRRAVRQRRVQALPVVEDLDEVEDCLPRLRPGRPDCDNLAKAVLDAGNGVLWSDDAQVVKLQVMKLRAALGEEPCVVVRVSEAVLNAVAVMSHFPGVAS